MEHNNERTIGLRQIMQLSSKHFPEIVPLVHKTLEDEITKMKFELAQRHARLILTGGITTQNAVSTTTESKLDATGAHIRQSIDTREAEVAYSGVKLCEEALKDLKLDYEKFKESTNATLASHGEKFAAIKKINSGFVELFKGVNENIHTVFTLANKR